MEAVSVKIFIASSAEVKDEREKCILILNQINKSHKHLHLKPVEWEYDIPHGSYPDFATVQEAINPLLKECNLCVFMFYSKIGKYTKEEFTLANELKKKIIPFFKEGFSPKTKEDIAKWAELIDFKGSFNETILYKDYLTLEDFELFLKDDLHLYLSEEFPLPKSYEIKPDSDEIKNLKVELYEKQKELDQVKSNRSLPDAETKNRLALLEQEMHGLTNELNQSKEIQEQQAKDKNELELRLAPQIARDNLKQQALTAIQENKYDEAKSLLIESAKDSISDTASTFYELGKVSKLQLLYKEALKYFELAVEIKPGDFDMNMEAGVMLRDSGYNDKAIIHFEKALQILQADNETDESNLSYLINELGVAYYNLGEFDKAIDYYEKSLAIDKNIYGEEHPEVAIRYNNLGVVYDDRGEHDKAINYYEQALAIDKKVYGEKHLQIATRYSNLGTAYNDKGEFDKAIDFFEKALAIDREFNGEEHPDIAINYNNLGAAHCLKSEYDKAIKYYELALAIDKKFYGEEHPNIATRYNNLGVAYRLKSEYDKAINYYELALAIDKRFNGEGHPDIAIDYNNLGLVYKSKGVYDKAITYYESALNIFEKFLPANHPSIATVKDNLAFAREMAKGVNK